MEQPLPDTELVVAPPERVSFDYQVAGLGTRAIAQLLDLLIISVVLLALIFAAYGVAAVSNNAILPDLILIIGPFVIIFGYFWTSEAMWSGQTLGKKAFRLRAVGDRGEPLTFMQAGIRNIVRIIDFLPYAYGVGLVVLFINGKGKRLGDVAAGTIGFKDSDHDWLWQLPSARSAGCPPPPPRPAPASQPPSTRARITAAAACAQHWLVVGSSRSDDAAARVSRGAYVPKGLVEGVVRGAAIGCRVGRVGRRGRPRAPR